MLTNSCSNLCTRNKKVFTHEHDLFTMPELRRHEKFGDDNPGAVDQSGFKGHPECGFCRERFYGDDELYTHCREKHERCHICDRRNAGRQPQYYIDYNSLEQHFNKDHFLCSDQECLEKKFVVFDSEIDLKAHQLESHPNGLTKDARREARRIDISGFDYRPHTQVDDRGGRRDRDGRGRGRGRDPNSEPLPPSSAQPLRRDELAYQRQMAIQTSQSVAPRTFGGQLTADAPTRPSSRPADRNNVATSTPAPRQTDNFPSLGSLSLSSGPSLNPSSSAPPQPLAPQEQARRLRHASVIERAAVLFKNDPRKMNDFQAKVSAYKASSITASEFLDWLFTTSGAAEVEIGKLLKELAELYESGPKRKELLQTWNDWKAVHEDYPALPGGAPASSSASWVKQGGTRVLNLKSRTAQSRRATSSAAPLSLPSTGVSASANRVGAGRASAPAWVSQAASSSRLTQTPPGSHDNSIAPSSRAAAPRITSDAFPALPPGKSSIFGSGFRVVKKNTGKGPATNAWGAKGGSSSENVSGNEDGEDLVEGENGGVNQRGKKKGNKNKKQVLMQWG
jgi:E3 ubiquitin-protein ligase ZNF598